MKIGFLLQRATDLKSMGPLAMESLERGHQAVLLYFTEVESKAKSYLQVKNKDLKVLLSKNAQAIGIRKEELDALKNMHKLDMLIVQEGYHSLNSELDKLQILREQGVKLISLSHFFEIAKRPLEALFLFDLTIYISDFAKVLHFKLQNMTRKQKQEMKPFSNQIAVAASPMFDQILEIDRKKARRELGIDQNSRVVLLVAPVISPITPWRHHVWRNESKLGLTRDAIKTGRLKYLFEIWTGSTFKHTYAEILSFCKRNDATLIVKSRGKQANLKFMIDGSDVFIDGFEDEYYPEFSTYKLLAASDLCITVNSMAAVEAVAAGIPCVNIYVPHDDRAAKSTEAKDAYNQILLGGETDSLMNSAGSIRKIDRRKANRVFANSDWQELAYAPSRKKAYLKKYLGIEKQSSSNRIMQKLEQMKA
jgi:hypothetical protein